MINPCKISSTRKFNKSALNREYVGFCYYIQYFRHKMRLCVQLKKYPPISGKKQKHCIALNLQLHEFSGRLAFPDVKSIFFY